MKDIKNTHITTPKRVVIASANPLFARGLRKVYGDSWGEKAVVVSVSTSMEEVLSALKVYKPDLVIVDHDDRKINRETFLNSFVASDTPMRVVLVSLGEVEPVVIYDRRQLTSKQAVDWLIDPWGV
ncbi:MAG: hypothetical protein JXA13_13415 [Anaerolineales bacterium]|nr:hypothetical protein [Anaerolineales bacterium]